MSKEKNKPSVTYKGRVISDKMDKTLVVQVDRVKMNPKYAKQYAISKKFKVHDEKNEYKVGDLVEFASCRPLSREKRWRVIYSK